ncbi:amino acid permease-domain-containing protein [Mycena albidolilacea]|uniref:Amino acid permease-domain-containing protein n=1 Tax=Mycena albidolilacea TaxID=1033008 RepID=A0AAD7A663_9AGAR|nr:amino acid permease-domain-containing protein [Mycena albidolilacea]
MPDLGDTQTTYGAVEDGPQTPTQPRGGLHRGLSARQVQMIAIGGTIGTGLFLGTGKSLAEGGPASLIIAYALVGFIVYVTLLLLGEMATQYPVAGSFNAYSARFFSPSYAFAISWNYFINDAVSTAGDLTAAQLVLQYWTTSEYTWVVSLIFWIFLVGVNATNVKSYGELEYWLSFLKVATVLVFIIVGVSVNISADIGTSNWRIPGAPFVGGFGGFARVFVTASFAYGGTESLGITAGETKNPSKNMPRVVKFVFWRILLFYILSILVIGLNVPWDYPNLSNKSTTTSPFTIVFKQAGSTFAASFMNTVILTSVLSAGNHALFAGTRVLYGLSVTKPPQAPAIFSWTTAAGVPLPALLLTSSVSVICFGTSFIGRGELWGWLQNIVGVSNQVAWLSIGLASWRFRKAWIAQGRALSDLKFHTSWTWPYGPPFVIVTVSALIIIQGWSSVLPVFSPVDFVSFYIEVPVIIVMYTTWALLHRPAAFPPSETAPPPSDSSPLLAPRTGESTGRKQPRRWLSDLVDVQTVDLDSDQYEDEEADKDDEAQHAGRSGMWRRLYHYLA